MLVHHVSKARQIALHERCEASPTEIFDIMQVVDHRRILRPGFDVLVPQYGRGRASIAGEEQAEPVLEIVENLGADWRSVDRNAVVLVEFKTGYAAIGGDELVLLADGFVQQVDLDMAGLVGERMRTNDVALARMQRPQ